MKLNTQKGAATILTAVILLIAITLVAMLSGKTVLNETKIAADNYRTTQSVAAANYAMDLGVNYFDNGGFDQVGAVDADGNVIGDGVSDNLGALTLSSTDGTQNTSATVNFDNAAAECGGGTSWQNGRITATGLSDDGLATRTITQCVGPIGLVKDNGPDQPVVAQGQVFMTGTANIVNRYTNTTVWSGGEFVISTSASISTFIKGSSVGVLNSVADLDRLIKTDVTVDTQIVSNQNLGNGLDIIDDDPNLSNLEGDRFFDNFFEGNPTNNLARNIAKKVIKSQAADSGQVYDDPGDAVGKSGIIWIGNPGITDVSTVTADYNLGNGIIGSKDSPAVLVVNGNLRIGGNPEIYGLVYVIGTYEVAGNPDIIGSNVVEGTDITTGNPAAAPIISGNGTLNLIFWPAFGDTSGNPIDGLTAVIPGSWRDW